MPYTLGIDLGANSLGWAAIRIDNEETAGVLAAGVRVFPAGMSGLETGADESHAAKRRQARLQRRQTDRRRRRIQKIYRILAEFELLPEAKDAAQRTHVLGQLDRELKAKFQVEDELPYTLRARALDHKLEPREVGRALFHLAQRRGFLSNRKSVRESDEERGAVKSGIASLTEQIAATHSRTLGEYLSKLDSTQERVRRRYTARQMYLDEFDKIWDAQHAHHADLLTETRKARLHQAMFFQRPLRDQEELIGDCELEPQAKRAPVWHPAFQKFRVLQEVNHLRLIDGAGAGRPLDERERESVLKRLEDGDLPLKDLRKMLGLGRSVQFNLEEGGKKTLIGNRTEAKLRRVFQHRWDAMPEGARYEAIVDLASDLDETVLVAKARDHWQLSELQALEYAETVLEHGKYASYSVAAIRRLLPHLERGSDVTSARLAEYPDAFATPVLESLPEVRQQLKEIRNPGVVRALSELRKVVNALCRRYGKPEEIHIELARELKAARPEREERWKRMRRNERERTAAYEKLQKEIGIPKPGRADIEKWLLAEECGWQCPYTLRGFSKYQLFHSGEIQVEHIIPFSRSLDDSFANKTLAYASVNALKGNRSPFEAFSQTAEWEQMLERVRSFKSPLARHKLQRFQWDTAQVSEVLNNFTARQLNDTRYAGKLAARYLACLYGRLADQSGRQRIFVSPGQVTAFLRRLWGIEGLLSGEDRKTRDDHRHHLIDAVAIALTGPKWVKALSDAASQAHAAGRRRFATLPVPWPDFVEDVRKTLATVIVSHRAHRKVGGPMHDETFYGIIRHPEHGDVTVKRKPVHLLSPNEVEQIVDSVVREKVRLQIGRCGDAKKLEADPPMLPAKDGREIPIRKVRIAIAEQPRPLSSGLRQRNVIGDEYHHFEIFSKVDPRTGKSKWMFEPVTTQQAMERVRDKQPLVAREHGPGTKFALSIAKGDTLEITEGEQSRLVVVQALEATTGKVGFKSILDARPYQAANRNRQRVAIGPIMTEYKCRKVTVLPLGDVRPSHD